MPGRARPGPQPPLFRSRCLTRLVLSRDLSINAEWPGLQRETWVCDEPGVRQARGSQGSLNARSPFLANSQIKPVGKPINSIDTFPPRNPQPEEPRPGSHVTDKSVLGTRAEGTAPQVSEELMSALGQQGPVSRARDYSRCSGPDSHVI